MAKCSAILDVARTRTEMVEQLQRQEEEAARLQEDAKQDQKLLTNLMNCVDEQARLVEAVRERRHLSRQPTIAKKGSIME